MKKDSKSSGRKKRVTQSTGSVQKRGDGVNTSGPVGKKDGYAKRKQYTQSSKPSQSSNIFSSGQSTSSSGSYSNPSGSNTRKSGLSFKKILIIAGVIIIGYFLITRVFNSSDSTGLVPINNNPVNVQTDNNATSIGGNEQLNTTVSDGARDKRTIIEGSGDDIYTIMVYMCGTDLESGQGMATADLQEMLNANISDKVNIIVETGGTKTWKNDVISSKTNQRYKIEDGGLLKIQDNLGKKIMTDPDTLSNFIKYCKSNYKAERYSLILWDHGGGSARGFGYDEYAPNTTMTLGEIDEALAEANVDFDFIGFDACLMATFETAVMLDKYADYLIASEETEPGIGWYYTNWLSNLSSDTSMSTLQIGKNIIDDFIDTCAAKLPRDKTTLSIIDLAELSGTVPEAFTAFALSTGDLIDSDEYKVVSDARSGTREFAVSSRLDQIDLVHLAENIGTTEAKELASVLLQSIKYNRTSTTMSDANGLSIYFPYGGLASMGSMLSTYEEIGMDEEYSECIKSFANLEAGGQIASSGSANPFGSLIGSFTGGQQGGGSLITGLLGSFFDSGNQNTITGTQGEDTTDWLSQDEVTGNTEYYQENYIDSANIALLQKDGEYVLSLSDKEWDLIQTVNLNVFLDDGDGYIDLGMDNVYQFNNDGDLVIDFDKTWLAINGQVVSYYFISEDTRGERYTITGRVPAMLNDQLVDLVIIFDNDNPYGDVIGAQMIYQDNTNITAKGLVELEYGDTIDFLCDYYTYDEEYTSSYYLGDQMVVQGSLEISNVSVGSADCKVTYRLTDIYNNTYWTPAVDY